MLAANCGYTDIVEALVAAGTRLNVDSEVRQTSYSKTVI